MRAESPMRVNHKQATLTFEILAVTVAVLVVPRTVAPVAAPGRSK